jgi:4'-phosphopantetheinyl transferase
MTTPPLVTWLSAGMDSVPSNGAWVDEALAARLAGMRYAKRRDEARLGRWTAKNAIARSLGLDADPDALRRVLVRNAFDGAPEAWVGERRIDAVIAMTDRADWAVCAVLHGSPRIGCDLELVEPRSEAFVSDYLTADEQTAVRQAADPHLLANVIWSAKESALKVLRTGLRRDTRTVEVRLLGEEGPAPWRRLTVTSAEGREFPGWWLRYGQFVLTCATEVATESPRSLDEPPALASAEPTHRWMEDPLPSG